MTDQIVEAMRSAVIERDRFREENDQLRAQVTLLLEPEVGKAQMISERKFSKQAEMDFMHNFRHDTEGDRWAKHEIETLRQHVALLRDAIETACHHIELHSNTSYYTVGRDALDATKPKPLT